MRRAYHEYYALFMATLIREDHVKGSKSLPAFKLFFDKNNLKAGKNFDRLTRSSRMRVARNRGWPKSRIKWHKALPAFKLFFDENSLKAGKNFDRLARSSRMRVARNREWPKCRIKWHNSLPAFKLFFDEDSSKVGTYDPLLDTLLKLWSISSRLYRHLSRRPKAHFAALLKFHTEKTSRAHGFTEKRKISTRPKMPPRRL